MTASYMTSQMACVNHMSVLFIRARAADQLTVDYVRVTIIRNVNGWAGSHRYNVCFKTHPPSLFVRVVSVYELVPFL